MNFISIDAIKTDFDHALMKAGYVRTKVMAEHWGTTAEKINKCFKNGYTCDCFMVNNVRYMSVTSQKPEGI